jgi:hypothetical protein
MPYPPWLALRGEAMVVFRSPCLDSIKAVVHSTFDGDVIISCHALIYIDECFIHMCS